MTPTLSLPAPPTSLPPFYQLANEALEKLEANPSFPEAHEFCSAIRCAWGEYYSCWQLSGRIAEFVTEELQTTIQRGLEAIRQIPTPADAEEAERLVKYQQSISFRNRMITILNEQGVAAVDREFRQFANEVGAVLR